LALHFEFGDQKSSAKPLQDLIVLKQNVTNCRRRVRSCRTWEIPELIKRKSGRK